MQAERNYYKGVKCTNHEFLLEQLKYYHGGKNLTQKKRLRGPTTWKDMLKNALRDIVKWRTKKTEQQYKVSSPSLDDQHFKNEELESVGELSKVCSQIVLICFYLARNGGPDILWSVHKLARATTNWTEACDERFARLISHIHHTRDYRQHCHVCNTAQHCRLGPFQGSDFAGDL